MLRYWDIEELLLASGWKETAASKKERRRPEEKREPGFHLEFQKRYKGEWILLWLQPSPWASSVFVFPSSTRGISDDLWKAHRDELKESVAFSDVTKKLDATGNRIAKRLKDLRGSRKKPTYENFMWGRERGPEGYAAWKEEVEAQILQQLKRQKEKHAAYKELKRKYGKAKYEPPWRSTAEVSEWVLLDDMIPTSGMTKTKARREVRSTLERLAKSGKILKEKPGGRQIYWELIENNPHTNKPKETEKARPKKPTRRRKKNPKTTKRAGVRSLVAKALK